jgi:hypothetical protein
MPLKAQHVPILRQNTKQANLPNRHETYSSDSLDLLEYQQPYSPKKLPVRSRYQAAAIKPSKVAQSFDYTQ